MDQLALSFTPGIGHNQPPEPIDPIEGLNLRLAATHAELLARFSDLELACGRVPDPIASEEDAATATDFIAQCQLHIKQGEAAHKTEKALFLRAGRAVDTFFKRRRDSLEAALAPTIARLKTYRDRLAEVERQRHAAAQRRASEEAARLEAEAEEQRSLAQQRGRSAQSFEERRRAVEALQRAEEAEQRALLARREAAAPMAPTHVRGDYGATAFVRRGWTFEVVNLDQVPREYMSLDVAVVREAITRDGVRIIPGLRIFRREALRVRSA